MGFIGLIDNLTIKQNLLNAVISCLYFYLLKSLSENISSKKDKPAYKLSIKIKGAFKMQVITNTRFDQAVDCTPEGLKAFLKSLPESVKHDIQEVRLRINRPVALYGAGKMRYLTKGGKLTTFCNGCDVYIISASEINATFQNICNYSVYSRQNEIRSGFVTMQGGHRAGICGTAVYDDDGITITNIRDISSINIRISRQITGVSDELLSRIDLLSGGLLLCGVPASGKTTILRDMALRLTNTYGKKVAVVDERGELAGTSRGVMQNDLGQSDVLDGYRKGEGILHAIRCLSPEIIICDEVGNSEDIAAVSEGLNAGVSLAVSVHCSSKSDFKKRKQAMELLNTGAFKHVVFLKNRSTPGEIKEICTADDMLL